MSQPPGPPGPYNQYPGQGQPQGGYPGQGQPQGGFPGQGQPQSGGFPGQGHPQSGGFPAQQPGYGPPQGPPPGQFPPGGYPPQGGYDPYGGGGKKKSPLPWILGGIGALVVIGGVILAIVLLSGSSGPGSSAEDTGKALVEAVNNKDADAIKEMLCASDRKLSEQSGSGPSEMFDEKEISAEFVSATENGDKGTANIKVTEEGKGTQEVPVPLAKEDDKWMLCFTGGMNMPSPSGGPGAPPGGASIPPPTPN